MKLYRGGAQVTCDVLMCSQVFLVTSLKTQHTTAYARCSCVTFTGHRPHGGFELVKETCAVTYLYFVKYARGLACKVYALAKVYRGLLR